MLAHLHEITCKVFVVFGIQVVVGSLFRTAVASRHRHPPGSGVAERLEYGIRSFLLYHQEDAALSLVPVPMKRAVFLVLKSLKLRTESFAAPGAEMVRRAVGPLGVVSAAYVIAEDPIVQPLGRHQPLDQRVQTLLRPLAALLGPPTQAHSKTLKGLGTEIYRKKQRQKQTNLFHLAANIRTFSYICRN